MPLARRITTLGLLWMAAFGFATSSSSTQARAARVPGARSDLTAVAGVCDRPVRNWFSCDARVVVSRKTGRAIHPKVRIVKSASVAAVPYLGTSAPDKMTPRYLQQAYDLTALSATAGTGDTVAIVGVYNAPDAESDMATFRTTYNLPACSIAAGCLKQVNQEGQSVPRPRYDSGWSQEESMDLDAVSSICPRCKIDLIEASSPSGVDLQAALTEAINLGADQVSISGTDEASSDPFSNFNHAGVAIFAAAGDDGVVPTGEANYPAALPFVNAVGGTSISAQSSATPTARGIAESAWSTSGSGCVTQQQPLSYQPALALGCSGRLYSDISADADPITGLLFYDAHAGGWLQGGGTSLSTPLTAAYAAITGVDATSPQWAYTDSEALNIPAVGSISGCSGQVYVVCSVNSPGYTGPTGVGAISGDVVAGAPGIGDPSYGGADAKTYVTSVGKTSVKLAGGVYPNLEETEYYWEYGTTSTYGLSTPRLSAGSFSGASAVDGDITQLRPGTVYHSRLVAVNASGTSYGYDYWFKTSGTLDYATRTSMR